VVSTTSRPLYPLERHRRLGGPQGRSGRVRKISPPPGFDPRTVAVPTELPGPLHTYIRTYIYTYTHIHTYVHIYIYTYIQTYVHTYLLTYLPTYPRKSQGSVTRPKAATWDRLLCFPSEGRHAVDFFARKIRRLRSGPNTRSWVPETSVLTTRPPYPLSIRGKTTENLD
jgi:hypothetical protein